jgi:hypothetical protein
MSARTVKTHFRLPVYQKTQGSFGGVAGRANIATQNWTSGLSQYRPLNLILQTD